MTYKTVYGSRTEIPFGALDSLLDGSDAYSASMINNITDGFIEAEIDVTINATAVGPCHVYLVRSSNGVDHDTAFNDEYLGVVNFVGAGAATKHFRVHGLPPYWSLRIVNMTGGSLASSGNSVHYTGIRYAVE